MITKLYRIKQSAPAHTAGNDITISTHADRESALLSAKALATRYEGVYIECRLYADDIQQKHDKPFDTDIVWADWL